MKYHYFISYSYQLSFGYISMNSDRVLKCIEDINLIKKGIENERHLKDVVIINIQRFPI